MFPVTENIRQDNDQRPQQEMLQRTCSGCGRVFRKPNKANAAQEIGVDFRDHNHEHQDQASLSTAELVWVAV